MSEEARFALELAGHRLPAVANDGHDCFAMNCRDLGDEVARLRARLEERDCPEPEDELEPIPWPGKVEGVAGVKGPDDVAPPPPKRRR